MDALFEGEMQRPSFVFLHQQGILLFPPFFGRKPFVEDNRLEGEGIPEPLLSIEKLDLRLPIAGPQKHVVLVQNRKTIALGLKGGFLTFPTVVFPSPGASHMRADMPDCLPDFIWRLR